MFRFLVILAVASSLGGCAASSVGGIDAFVTTLNKDKCSSSLTFNASVGALNPGSGGSIGGTINCPGQGTTVTTVTGAAVPPATAPSVTTTLSVPPSAPALQALPNEVPR